MCRELRRSRPRNASPELFEMSTETKHKDQVVILIDQQRFRLDDRGYTARELLQLAGEDPAETTLVLRHGNDLRKYNDLNENIDLNNGMHFVVFHNGPTPVS
jgi:hypothetical protein